MSEVKRYDVELNDNRCDCGNARGIEEVEYKHGDYVRYSDHAVYLNEMQLERDAAKSELSALREELAEAARQKSWWVDSAKTLDERLTAAEQRNAELVKALATEQAIKEPAGENVLWQVLDASVGVLTRRAAPHAWESEAHQAGLKIIMARREGLTVTALKPTESGASE